MSKKPAFIEERKKIFDELIDEQNKKYLGKYINDDDVIPILRC